MLEQQRNVLVRPWVLLRADPHRPKAVFVVDAQLGRSGANVLVTSADNQALLSDQRRPLEVRSAERHIWKPFLAWVPEIIASGAPEKLQLTLETDLFLDKPNDFAILDVEEWSRMRERVEAELLA